MFPIPNFRVDADGHTYQFDSLSDAMACYRRATVACLLWNDGCNLRRLSQKDSA